MYAVGARNVRYKQWMQRGDQETSREDKRRTLTRQGPVDTSVWFSNGGGTDGDPVFCRFLLLVENCYFVVLRLRRSDFPGFISTTIHFCDSSVYSAVNGE